MQFEAIPVHLRTLGVQVRVNEKLERVATVYFVLFHTSGIGIRLQKRDEFSPVKLHLTATELDAFFEQSSTRSELFLKIRRHYDAEVQKRRFKLIPHPAENLSHWSAELDSWRRMRNCPTVEGNVVPWTELYPKGSQGRKYAHHFVNSEGRKRRDRKKTERETQIRPIFLGGL